MTARRKRGGAGFTLLEVIFAIALLLGSLTIIGQFVVNGVRSAGEAESLTIAELLCESTLAEAISGAIPLESASGIPIDSVPGWEYSLQIDQVESTGLLAIQVTVSNAGSSPRPAEFSLFRWVLDPEYVQQQVDNQASLEQQATTSQQSSSGTNTSGGTPSQ
jgi:type II secretory pathway pseudopilin PulG